MQLRNCQIAALEAIQNNNVGIIDMCCGAGKTRVIAEECKKHNLSVIFVPKNMLFDQFVNDEVFNNFEHVFINCNNKPVVPKGKKKVIMFCNDKSFHILKSFLQDNDLTPNFIAYDEAHLYTSKTQADDNTSDSSSTLAGDIKCMFDFNCKRIFFTATPNSKMINNPDVFGNRIYTYSYAQGVKDKVVVPIETVMGFSSMDLTEPVKVEDMYKSYYNFLIETIKEHNLKRIVVYCSNVNESSTKTFRTSVGGFYPFFSDFDGVIHRIKGSTSHDDREDIFRQFKSPQKNIQIILSCDTISEGIDVSSCDGVFLAAPSVSVSKNVQRALRCCRLNGEDKRKGIVMVPLFVNQEELKEFSEQEQKTDYIKQHSRGHMFEYIQAIISCLIKDLCLDIFYEFDVPNQGKVRVENGITKKRLTRRQELIDKIKELEMSTEQHKQSKKENNKKGKKLLDEKKQIIAEKEKIQEELKDTTDETKKEELLNKIEDLQQQEDTKTEEAIDCKTTITNLMDTIKAETEEIEKLQKELNALEVIVKKQTSKVVMKFFDNYSLSIEQVENMMNNITVKSGLIKIDREKSLRYFHHLENRKPIIRSKNPKDYLGMTEAQLANTISLCLGVQNCNPELLPVIYELGYDNNKLTKDKFGALDEFDKIHNRAPKLKQKNPRLYCGYTEEQLAVMIRSCIIGRCHRDLTDIINEKGWSLDKKEKQITEIKKFSKEFNRPAKTFNNPQTKEELREHKLGVQLSCFRTRGSNSHLKETYEEEGWI